MIKMWVLILSLILCMSISSIAFAGDFGPIEPNAKPGTFSVGVGYFYHTSKWEPDKSEHFTDTKVLQNQVYLQLSYCVVKNLEFYLRGGGADFKANDFKANNTDISDFRKGMKPFGTAGIKAIVYDYEGFAIGPFVQGSLFSNFEQEKTITVKFKQPWEVNAGVGLQLKRNDFIIYGGPVAYWNRAKIESEVSGTTYSTNCGETGDVGGFLGVKIPLYTGLSFELETQLKSRVSVGGNFTYAF
jgi:hypothetical protein